MTRNVSATQAFRSKSAIGSDGVHRTPRGRRRSLLVRAEHAHRKKCGEAHAAALPGITRNYPSAAATSENFRFLPIGGRCLNGGIQHLVAATHASPLCAEGDAGVAATKSPEKS